MIAYVLSKILEPLGIIEDYSSLIWKERFNEAGEFEMVLPLDYSDVPWVHFGNFIYIKDSERLMVIETIKQEISEGETSLVLTGRSAETILQRRTIFEETLTVKDTAKTIIHRLLNEHFISPSDNARQISLFGPLEVLGDITPIFEDQFDTQSVYDIVVTICKAIGAGFILRFASPYLLFRILIPYDRSYSQTEYPPVIFSDGFENLLSSSYHQTIQGSQNIVLVVTDVKEVGSLFVEREGGFPTLGLNRYEGYLTTSIVRDATDPPLTDEEIIAIAITRGREYLAERRSIGLFEAEFDMYFQFVYGVDYYLGDIVQCKSRNVSAAARLVEIVRNFTQDGTTTYGTFDFDI